MHSSYVNSFPLATHKIGIILLAAGRGSRMGGPLTKLLLPMPDGRPVLLHSIENAYLLGPASLIVVVRPDLRDVLAAPASPFSHISSADLPPVYVENARFDEGMGTSLAMGASALSQHLPDAAAGLVLLGDEPGIHAHVVEKLVQAFLQQRGDITLPIYGSQPGPPTIFSRALFPELMLLDGDTGGRQLVARYPDRTTRVPFSESERPHDLDTPGDYEALLKS